MAIKETATMLPDRSTAEFHRVMRSAVPEAVVSESLRRER
jgi:hypothetical protein